MVFDNIMVEVRRKYNIKPIFNAPNLRRYDAANGG